jgi:hypothetical protein
MVPEFIARNADLKRLWDDGYEIEVRELYLIVHHIPYLNVQLEIKYGILVTPLEVAGDSTIKPTDHKAYFIGSLPYKADGTPVFNTAHNPQVFLPGLQVEFMLSLRPDEGYQDFYEKITRYETRLSMQARKINSLVKAQTFQVIEAESNDSIFNYYDANSTRALINPISMKVEGLKIGIVGLGGTGSYILDLVSKTPVYEIHLFDGDYFGQHNAFRSPGAASIEDLKMRHKKVSYFADLYSRMHRGIKPHDYKITEVNVNELSCLNFVFLSLDNGPIRKIIVDFLIEKGIPFIHVGIGMHQEELTLFGHTKTILATPDKYDHVYSKIPFDDKGYDVYSTNIQIAELNSINAAFAVLKWKKLFGIYRDSGQEYNSTFSIANAKIFYKEDIA